MAKKLNQVLAVERDIKSRANRAVTDLHHQVQKAPLLSGISRTYQPRDQEGEHLPGESNKVQIKAAAVLTNVADHLSELFDVIATKDATNCAARGDIVVDGTLLLKGVPVTTLLFLEKQLTDLGTIIDKLPTLDPGKSWAFDDTQDCYAADPVKTVRTKKIPRNHVKAKATDKHPEQVEVYYEDVTVGDWTTVAYSGALPAATVTTLRRRLDKLRDAVKVAREQANAAEVVETTIGETFFGYLLTDLV